MGKGLWLELGGGVRTGLEVTCGPVMFSPAMCILPKAKPVQLPRESQEVQLLSGSSHMQPQHRSLGCLEPCGDLWEHDHPYIWL